MGDYSLEHENVVLLELPRKSSRKAVLEQLHRVHSHSLRCFLHARLNRDDLVEGILQDVFERLARVDDLSSRVNGERGNVRSFLFSIANNLLIDRARRENVRRRYAEMIGSDESVSQITPEQSVAGQQELAKAKTVLMKLAPKCRRAFLLSRFEDQSYAEIANTMNLSVKTVEYYISKALASLRAEIER